MTNGDAKPAALPAEPCAEVSTDELCRFAQVSIEWVHAHLREGLIEGQGDDAPTWRFDAVTVQRVRRIAHLERHFDAAPELAALVADLEAEIARMRRRYS